MSHCGKTIFPNKGEASQQLLGMKKVKGIKTGNVYFCDDCQGWHLSSGGVKRGNRRRRKSYNKTDKQETHFADRNNRQDKRNKQTLHIRKTF